MTRRSVEWWRWWQQWTNRPFFRWPQRRFSLRQLLMAVALLAILLSFAGLDRPWRKVQDLAFSPDGKTLAVETQGMSRGRAFTVSELLDMQTHRLTSVARSSRWSFYGSSRCTSLGIAFLADGETVVEVTLDGPVVRNLADGTRKAAWMPV